MLAIKKVAVKKSFLKKSAMKKSALKKAAIKKCAFKKTAYRNAGLKKTAYRGHSNIVADKFKNFIDRYMHVSSTICVGKHTSNGTCKGIYIKT